MTLAILLCILGAVLLACAWIDRRTKAEMRKPEHQRNPTLCPPRDDEL